MNVTITGVLAAYAAVVSTINAFVGIRKWKGVGLHLTMSASSGYKIGSPTIVLNESLKVATLIRLSVKNVGGRKTTITNVVFKTYSGKLAFWPIKPKEVLILSLAIAYPNNALPHLSEPGNVWDVYFNEDDPKLKAARTKLAYIGITDSISKKPKWTKVKWEEK